MSNARIMELPRLGDAGRRAAATLAALGLALLTGALVFLAYGADPLAAYGAMAGSALGSWQGLSEVVVKAIPLTLTGLAVALPATMLLWNIGAEGQFVWGAIGASFAALFLPPYLPAPLILPAAALCGALAGGLWALIPAALRVRWNVSEILTTLLLNYVAIIAMEWLYYGPWRDPMGMGFPGTPMFPDEASLPRLAGTRIHYGMFLAVAAALALRVMLDRTRWGYSVRVIGRGPAAAAYAGLNAGRHTLLVMALAGALAGLAGMGEVTGIHYGLREGINVGYGYDGIIVACMAGFSPLAVPLFALLLGAFQVGGEGLSTAMQLPTAISQVLEAALLLGLLASEAALRWRPTRRGAAVVPSVSDAQADKGGKEGQ